MTTTKAIDTRSAASAAGVTTAYGSGEARVLALGYGRRARHSDGDLAAYMKELGRAARAAVWSGGGPEPHRAGLRPQAEINGAAARSICPVATLARCLSISASVAMPGETSRLRICRTVATSRAVNADDVIGKNASDGRRQSASAAVRHQHLGAGHEAVRRVVAALRGCRAAASRLAGADAAPASPGLRGRGTATAAGRRAGVSLLHGYHLQGWPSSGGERDKGEPAAAGAVSAGAAWYRWEAWCPQRSRAVFRSPRLDPLGSI